MGIHEINLKNDNIKKVVIVTFIIIIVILIGW